MVLLQMANTSPEGKAVWQRSRHFLEGCGLQILRIPIQVNQLDEARCHFHSDVAFAHPLETAS